MTGRSIDDYAGSPAKGSKLEQVTAPHEGLLGQCEDAYRRGYGNQRIASWLRDEFGVHVNRNSISSHMQTKEITRAEA